MVLRQTLTLAALCVALPGEAQEQVGARHAVRAEVRPVLAIRDSRLTTDSARASTGWAWQGSVLGNAPFRLEVRVPDTAGDGGRVRARAGSGQWIALDPGQWVTVATGIPGRHALRVEVSAAGPGAGALLPEVRATAR